MPESLPAFSSREEAEAALYALRDDRRAAMDEIAATENVALDYSPDSLKTLEEWYFTLCETDGFNKLGITRDQFETADGKLLRLRLHGE